MPYIGLSANNTSILEIPTTLAYFIHVELRLISLVLFTLVSMRNSIVFSSIN